MTSAVKARRRVFVRGPGSAFLDADSDVMSLILDWLLPNRGYGKAKLSTVCKTLYNRYAKDNCHNRAVWLYNLHMGIEMRGCRPLQPSWVYQIGNGNYVWKYSEPEHRVWSERSEPTMQDSSSYWAALEPPCLGTDRLNVRLKNIKVESSAHRRTCRHPQYWRATEEERRYARMFQYTKTTDVVTFDVALEPDALVRDWTDTGGIIKMGHQENHRISQKAGSMMTERMPWFDTPRTQQPQTAHVVACYPNCDPKLQVGDIEMGTVPGYDKQQEVFERRILESFHLEVSLKGPGFVATAVGQLRIDASNAPFRTTQRVEERCKREKRAFLRLNDLRFARGMPLVFLVEPVSTYGLQIYKTVDSNPYSRDETGRMPKWHPLMTNYAPGRDHALEDRLDLCNSAAVVRWIRKFLTNNGARHMTEGLEDLSDDEEDDVWPTEHRPGGRDRYWSKQWALARHRATHTIKAPATVRWTSVSYDCMPPHQLASVRVHEPYVAELLDAHVTPSSDGQVRLQIVPRVRNPDGESSSSSDEEDLLPQERARRRRLRR